MSVRGLFDGGRLEPGDGRVVLVSGASSGLGRATAGHLARRGFTVLAGTRSAADGESVVAEAGPNAHSVLLDVTDADSVAAAGERVVEVAAGRGLWGLVNNAGTAISAPLECVPPELMRHQLETNVVGHLSVIRTLLPELRRARGRIANVTSGLGSVAFPYLGPYAAGQFGKEGMSLALRRELAPQGVRVIVIAPGAIMTPLWGKISEEARRVLESSPPAVAALYRESFENFLRMNEERARTSRTRPEDVAAAIGHAIGSTRPRGRYRIGPDVFWGSVLARALPEPLIDRFFAPIVSGSGSGTGAKEPSRAG